MSETSSSLHVVLPFCILSIKAKGESKCKKRKEAHISRLRAVVFLMPYTSNQALSIMNRKLVEDLTPHQILI